MDQLFWVDPYKQCSATCDCWHVACCWQACTHSLSYSNSSYLSCIALYSWSQKNAFRHGSMKGIHVFSQDHTERCCFNQTPGLHWITTSVLLFLRYRSLFWITGLLKTSQILKHFDNITFECFPLCPDIYRTSTSFWSFEHFWRSNITEAGVKRIKRKDYMKRKYLQNQILVSFRYPLPSPDWSALFFNQTVSAE